jgi:hypothetical protein
MYSSLDEVYGSDFTTRYTNKLMPHEEAMQVQGTKDLSVLFKNPTEALEREACSRDFSEIRGRMTQGRELPPYCSKENDKFREFQSQSNTRREEYLKNMDKERRIYNQSSVGMYDLKNPGETLSSAGEGQDRVYIQQRLNELEKELKKYQFMIRVFDEEERFRSRPAIEDLPARSSPSSPIPPQEVEYFSGRRGPEGAPLQQTKDDLIDLVILIGVGLLLLFILDSVFKMGKNMQARR